MENGSRESGPAVKAKKIEVQRIRDGDVVLRQVLVPCGKANCTKCPHGPYWYRGRWSRGKWRETYIGKSLTCEKAQRDPFVAAVLRGEKHGRMFEVKDEEVDNGNA